MEGTPPVRIADRESNKENRDDACRRRCDGDVDGGSSARRKIPLSPTIANSAVYRPRRASNAPPLVQLLNDADRYCCGVLDAPRQPNAVRSETRVGGRNAASPPGRRTYRRSVSDVTLGYGYSVTRAQARTGAPFPGASSVAVAVPSTAITPTVNAYTSLGVNVSKADRMSHAGRRGRAGVDDMSSAALATIARVRRGGVVSRY